ncbi:MAG TPA: PQQ-binding-like beta-propeller repeat protein [Verrucomicrobiae bacterium]|nr:PQQ-binding-like beta-propeller repeat protein [Verrucomicrobiae bacterium]
MVVYAVRAFLLVFWLAAPLFARGDAVRLTNVWEFVCPDTGDSSPALAPNGTIYFGTWLGKLFAVNPDGSRQWVFHAGREIWSSPAVGADGTIYFGSRDHCCYAVTAEGKLRWRFQTAGWVDSSPAIAADGSVYFGSWDTNFYALHPDGRLAWRFPTAGPIVSSAAVGADGRIFFGSHDGRLYALSPQGARVWAFNTGGPILSSPALDEQGTIYFTSVDGFCYAVKPDGSLKWRVRTGGITGSSPVVGSDGSLYVGVNKKVWAFSADGQKLWQREATSDNYQEPIEAAPTLLSDGSLLVVSNYGLLTDFAQSGPAKWYFYLFGHGPACPAVSPGGTTYITGGKPNVGSVLFALPTSVSLAQSPWPKFRGNSQNTGRVRRQPL